MAITRLRDIQVLFHFTDRRNLESIRTLGGIYPLAELEGNRIVIPAPGGDEESRSGDRVKGLDQYVHLCFKSHHPMEFVARQSGRIGDTTFLMIHGSVLQWEGVLFVPGMANTTGIRMYPIEEAESLVDFEVLYTRTNWGDPNVQRRLQAAEKYEILIPKVIPLDLIWNPNG